MTDYKKKREQKNKIVGNIYKYKYYKEMLEH
jgi:hypothetical protein